jgi:catechol 2,3-dioxygenase-like lactoylglutathione lyase family enzyme
MPSAIGRRQALTLLAAGGAALRTAAAEDPPLHFTELDHIEFWTADVQRSSAFYARVFGNTVLKNNRTERRYAKIGSGFVAMDKGPDIRVDHVCGGIAAFQIESLHQYLKGLGIPYQDYPSGRDLYVTDPDGTRIQLGADSSWAQLPGSAIPVPLPGEPVFRPAGFDHILINVADPDKSEAFYAKIFGPVAQRRNNRTWFQAGKTRIGLLQTPSGQRPGVNHFCVSAAAFDYDAAIKALAQAGAKVEMPEIAGAPEFRDPDGYLIQVVAARA